MPRADQRDVFDWLAVPKRGYIATLDGYQYDEEMEPDLAEYVELILERDGRVYNALLTLSSMLMSRPGGWRQDVANALRDMRRDAASWHTP